MFWVKSKKNEKSLKVQSFLIVFLINGFLVLKSKIWWKLRIFTKLHILLFQENKPLIRKTIRKFLLFWLLIFLTKNITILVFFFILHLSQYLKTALTQSSNLVAHWLSNTRFSFFTNSSGLNHVNYIRMYVFLYMCIYTST